MKEKRLNNGIQMPAAGFGVFQVQDPEECTKAVLEAIETGYRLIDTAQSYGNEEAVGKAITQTSVLAKNCLSPQRFGSQIMATTNVKRRWKSL